MSAAKISQRQGVKVEDEIRGDRRAELGDVLRKRRRPFAGSASGSSNEDEILLAEAKRGCPNWAHMHHARYAKLNMQLMV